MKYRVANQKTIGWYLELRSFAKGDEGKGPEDAGAHPSDARGCPGGRLDQAVPQQIVAASAACAAPTVVVTPPIPVPTSWGIDSYDNFLIDKLLLLL